MSEPSASIRRRRAPIIGIAIAVFAIFSLYSGWRSEGFIAGDACSHYLCARYAFQSPTNFVDVWNRPLVTALYCVPAALGGRAAVRVVCMLTAIACGLVALAMARGQRQRCPQLALLFTLGQPLLFLHSFGEMTELPFAVLLGLAFLAYQRRRFWLAALLVSWTPLARPEGFGFVLLAALALLLHRRWRWIGLLPLPVIAWDVAGWLLSDRTRPWWRWLRDSWPYAGESLYGSGNVLTFVGVLPAVVSPFVLPATLIGIVLYGGGAREIFNPGSRHTESDSNRHPRLTGVLIAAIPLFVLFVHSLLYGFGKLASFGEARYLLVAAPFWGVLSARGWEWMFSRFDWPRSILWGAAAVVAPLIVVNTITHVVPVKLPPDWQSARRLADWYRGDGIRARYPRVMTSHPGLFYFLDIAPTDPAHVASWDRNVLRAPPPGTMLVWDPVYSDQNASAGRAITLEEVYKAGWVELRKFDLLPSGPDNPRGKGPRQSDPADARNYWHVFAKYVKPE